MAYRFGISVAAVFLILASLASSWTQPAIAVAQARENSESSVLTPEQRAEFVKGAKDVAGLDEQQIEKALEDPEVMAKIPVKVQVENVSVETPSSSATGDVQTQAVYKPFCKQKDAIMRYTDAQDKPIFTWTASKKWCSDGYKITSGSMDAMPWIRADSKYSSDTPGWRYVQSAESGTEGFVSFDGRAKGAHKSSRVGSFEFVYPGDTQPSGAARVGMVQTGRYDGTCLSVQYEPQAAPRITSGPSGTVVSKGARFAFSASESGARFRCSLDGAGFTSCTSPKTYSSLANGSHTFRLAATDSQGRAIPKPPTRNWKVDASALTVTKVSPAAGAKGVSARTNVGAVFSKEIRALSLLDNFTLARSGSTTPVKASLSYDPATNRSTLNPASNLAPGATYTARIKGGNNGIKDTTGKPLANSKAWSFTIAN